MLHGVAKRKNPRVYREVVRLCLLAKGVVLDHSIEVRLN